MTAVVGIGPALAATGHQKLNLLVGTIGTSANVALCIGLIPLWGPVGAAYAFLGSRILAGFLSVVVLHRVVVRTSLKQTLPRPLVASAAMAFALYYLPGLPLWLGILGGGSLYFLVLSSARGILREDLALVKDALLGAFFR